MAIVMPEWLVSIVDFIVVWDRICFVSRVSPVGIVASHSRGSLGRVNSPHLVVV